MTALCLLPLHHRLLSIMALVLDWDRAVRLTAVQRFVEQVRDGQAEPEDVERVLRVALGDRRLRLLLRVPGAGPGLLSLAGEPVAAATGAARVPLRSGGTDVGVLVLGAGSARRVRRAREAAGAARLPIEVSRLRIELRVALADVRASRARLASAGAQEQRRIERDLHDGAQQQIVAVGLRLRAVQRALGPGHACHAELDAAVDGLEATVGELRRLAHGIRRGRLDDGLAAALAHLARSSAIPIDLRVCDEPVPDLVATTAYFVVAEAVSNAMKHSGASSVTVTVARVGLALRVCVVDDGIGGADERGLTSLQDRVASVGGALTVSSPAGAGTHMSAVIPCAS